MTFKEACAATGKTNAEIAELASVKESTVEMYQKSDKPSHALKTVVATLLGGTPADAPVAPPTAPEQPIQTMSVDRDTIPADFVDNDEWHYLRVQDSAPGGAERVALSVAEHQAGVKQEAGGGKSVTVRYQVAHKFSDTFVIMKCLQSGFQSLRQAALDKTLFDRPKDIRPTGDGLSTTVKREERFIQGAAGAPTGDPIPA